MLFPPGREKSKKLHQLIRYVINRMKLYYCRYHLICFGMENLIFFQNALLRISAFVWAAVIVLSAFLAYEVLWRRKHPQVAAGRADEAEKKALWQDWFIEHFPGGVNDPTYCILKFTAKRVTYWLDFQFVKGKV